MKEPSGSAGGLLDKRRTGWLCHSVLPFSGLVGNAAVAALSLAYTAALASFSARAS